MPSVAIVGGGISGLATAHYLAKAGIASHLFEARPRLGGVIQTERVDGCVVEGGPDSFLSAKPWAMELIAELGLAGEVIGSNDHLRATFIWKGGKLIPLPDGVQFLVPTQLRPIAATPLLHWRTKLRMGLEYFHRRGRAGADDRTVADFVAGHYGQEVVDYLAEPLLSGIYGGDPAELSAASVLPNLVELEREYGSLTRGVLARRKAAAHEEKLPLFRTLRGGMAQLIAGLSSAVAGKATVVHAAVERIERTANGFRLCAGGDWLEAQRVVLACEAHQVAGLTRPIDTELSALTGWIPYRSSMTVALGYNRSDLQHPLNGFGFLVPKKERNRLVACTWVGTKFSDRAPDGMALLRCFLGEALDERDEQIIAAVLIELREMMGVRARPRFTRIFRWPRSMAQYTVGHAQRVARIEERLAAIPGLHVVGNGYRGIGIPDCVRMAKQVAERIARG
ncbi:MAG: protoporphyrinogen oxidase [Candidatus Solibacter usitatus]|nr:protoporphyrinogen oxidase [Candidatus Solibacter usitatus]